MTDTITFFWFRRDLRLEDNHGLFRALKDNKNVQCIFIFDTNILDDLQDKADARVTFLHDTITELHQQLQKKGSHLRVEYGEPIEVWRKLSKQYTINAIYCNKDYEPYAKERDGAVADLGQQAGFDFLSFKDQVIFEQLEITKKAGGPYTVYSPYAKQWKNKLAEESETALATYDPSNFYSHLHQGEAPPIPSLKEMGFERNTSIEIPSKTVAQKVIKNYDKTRNFPGIEGTSRLGIHFRFGTISIREKVRKAQKLNGTYLNELIWRDFYSMILANFPKVTTSCFKEKYEKLDWRNNDDEFEAWKVGKTGYPLVDAGMRQLNQTGYMHNRVRMVTASFLTKHLLIDWRWGEAYFAEKLLDFDLASNNGGWQWAAGCGTDAAPYFRIFNPTSQLKKFDKDLTYTKEWVPEVHTDDYPQPIVDHKFARQRCLDTYKAALKG